MKATIVYYTNCLAPKKLIRRTLSDAKEAAKENGWNLVVSSHLPLFDGYIDCSVDFHSLANSKVDKAFSSYLSSWDGDLMESDDCVRNYVTGVLSYSSETILTQIVHAISVAGNVDAIILWEHDVLYPKGYAAKMAASVCRGNDFSIYRNYVFMDHDGFFETAVHFWHLSRYAGSPQAMRSHFESKITLGNYAILEPVPKGYGTGEEKPSDVVDSFEIVEGDPVVDIKHGSNASGQILVDKHSLKNSTWGRFSKYERLICEDDYINFVNSKPEVGYGLFTMSGLLYFN